MLELRNISGGYRKTDVISNLSISFQDSEITSVIGVNGCGKTTLLMLCAGLLPLSSGTVLLDGENIAQLSRKELARRLSYLPQSWSSCDMTVRSFVSHGRFPYLGFPRRYSSEDIAIIGDAMELAGVSDFAEKRISELSGGQRQRVRIAMLLAQNTEAILLDEPLSFLDISHKLELMELITRLKELGKTIVIVMHELDLALKYSDTVAVMTMGSIAAADTPKIISESPVFTAALGVKAAYSSDSEQYFFSRRS